MNRILVILFSTIATSLVFSKRRKQRFAQKDSILKEIKNRHAAQRIEMNLALKEFNIKFASWMLYKSMTEKHQKHFCMEYIIMNSFLIEKNGLIILKNNAVMS
jgi:hypothetical protein